MKKFTLICKTAALLFFMVFCIQAGFTQKAVNNSSQSVKDSIFRQRLRTSEKGKLVPRAALTGATDNTTIKGTSTNLLIYNTAKAGTPPNEVYPGYYHNVGTTLAPNWKRVEVSVSEAVKNKKE
jgi:hypothetical protein